MKKKIFKCTIMLGICLSAIYMISSCCIEKKVPDKNEKKYLVYNMDSLPENLLLLNNENIREQDLNLNLFEGLVCCDKNGNPIPALASSWTISKDKLTYIFNIREDAKWSDGKKITSKDFQEFFQRILKEKNNSNATQLQCIFGVKDYINSNIDFDNVAIKATKENILEIRLNYPYENILKILSEPVFALKENFYNLRNWRNEYKKIKYSGAFIIEGVNDNGEISIIKNKNYWDEKNIISDRIYIKNKETTAFAVADYNSDSIDVFCNDDITELSDIPKTERISSSLTNKGVSINFNLNKKDGVIREINFRKSIKYAINKENIEKDLKGLFTKSWSYVPNELKNNISINYEANLVKAKELLRSTGYSGEIINIIYLNSAHNNEKIVNSILEDLKKLNIKAEATGFDKKEYKNVVNEDKYDMIIEDYKGEYNSPLCYLEKWISSSKFNIYGYNNAKFDNEVLKGKLASNKTNSNISYKNAEDILLKDVPIIPLGFYNFILCKKDYVEGIEVNNMGNIIIKKSYIEIKK